MGRTKKDFDAAERYAVWANNGKRCWICNEPLSFFETEVDHVFPETLLDDPVELDKLRQSYGLPSDFNINGYENWAPSHGHCNARKGKSIHDAFWLLKDFTSRLWKQAEQADKTAEDIKRQSANGKIFAIIFRALKSKRITVHDLRELIEKLIADPTVAGVPVGTILLDNGTLLEPSDIARRCVCHCEKEHCVGYQFKVQCYFSKDLSEWVIRSGLFHRCYDEEVECPRCHQAHKRGHIGKTERCGEPFLDQANQCD